METGRPARNRAGAGKGMHEIWVSPPTGRTLQSREAGVIMIRPDGTGGVP